MLLTLIAIFAVMVAAPAPVGSAAGSQGGVAGTLTLTDASGQRFDAPGVRLTLTCGATPDAARVATSDDHGTFRFQDVPTDRCAIGTDLQGFASATALAVVRAGGHSSRHCGRPCRHHSRAGECSFMARKTVQLIMRMLTDRECRDRFLANPGDMPLSEMGYDLTREEIEALVAIDRRLWEVGPDWVDDPALVVKARQWLARTDRDHDG